MIFGDSKLYSKLCRIKKGGLKLDPCMAELQAMIQDAYGVRPLALIYDHIDIGPSKGRPRLNVVMESYDDFAAIHRDRFSFKNGVVQRITKMFSAAVEKHDAGDKYSADNVLLISDDFSEEAVGKSIREMIRAYDDKLLESYADDSLWRIECPFNIPVFFFMDEKSKEAAISAGLEEEIRMRCYELAEPYDEFGYLSEDKVNVEFDSKENLDENFEAKMFYYFR